MKKFLSVIICLSMLIPLVTSGLSASPVSGACGDDLTWSFDPSDGVLTIGGSGDMTDYTSPSDVPWYPYRAQITGADITSDITYVSKNVFYGCTSLEYCVYDNAKYLGNGENPYLILVSVTDEQTTGCEINEAARIIYHYAFTDCVRMRDVTLPQGLVMIGDQAFADCPKIASLTIPDGVVYIGDGAFASCKKLTSLSIPDGVTQIKKNTFFRCSALESIVIPEGVTQIGQSAFNGCSGLTRITLHNGVTSIGSGAFTGCTSLTDVYYGGTQTDWENVAMDQDTRAFLDTVNVHFDGICGDRLTWEFDASRNLLTVSGTGDMFDYASPSDVPWYGYKDVITSVTLGTGVTSVGANALSCFAAMTDVILPETLTAVHDSAFSGCASLTGVNYTGSSEGWGSITIGNDNAPLLSATLHMINTGMCGDDIIWTLDLGTGALTIDGTGEMTALPAYDSAPWYGKRSVITSAVISEGITFLSSNAFNGCSALTNISLPDSLEAIGGSVFTGCNALNYTVSGKMSYLGNPSNPCLVAVRCEDAATSCALNANTKFIYEWAFDDCVRLRTVTIPEGVVSIGPTAFGNCPKLTSIAIPASVRRIEKNAFATCTGMTSMTVAPGNTVYHSDGNCIIESATGTLFAGCKVSVIPSDGSVTSIGDGAFFGQNTMTQIAIPDTVTSIGASAFGMCRSLTEISLPAGIRSVGESAFSGCSGLAAVTIPDGIGAIEGSTFLNCTSLASVSLPLSVKSVGASAFSGCSSLVTVYYAGTASDFAGVAIDNKGGGNYPFLNATFYYGFRESGVCGDDLFWSFDAETGTLTVEGSGAMTAYGSFDDAPWSFAADLMTSVYLPAGMTSVSAHAFAGCTVLSDVYFGGSAQSWSTVSVGGDNAPLTDATYHFTSSGVLEGGLVWSYDAETGLLSFTGDGAVPAFDPYDAAPWSVYSDGITSVLFPSGLTAVGANAFAGCSALTGVYYEGEAADWAAVSVDNTGNAPLLSASLHFVYTVTYDANGGSFAPPVQIIDRGNSASVTMTEPVKTYKITFAATPGEVTPDRADVACIFDGWNTSADGTGASFEPGDAYSGTSAVLYAMWSDPALGELPVPTGGYAFEGWYTEISGGDEVTANTTVTSNTTLFARWAYSLDTSEIYPFANSKNSFGTTYTVSDDDFMKLCDYVRILYKDDASKANSVINGLQTARVSDWGGSCYGMAVTTLLDKYGQIGFNENFDPAAATMHDVATPQDNSAVESAINYYHIAQKIPYLRNENAHKYRKEKADWSEGLLDLIETAKHGTPLLFCYSFGSSAHAIVIKGYRPGEDGSHNLIAYDNRRPTKDVIVKIDRNLYSCVVNNTEDCKTIEFYEDMSSFDVIDIDGPENDYANYTVPSGGSSGGGQDDGNAEITLRSSGRVTVLNADGETMIFENGTLTGTMEIEDEYFTVGEDDPAENTFTFTVDNSEWFRFTPEAQDLYVSVVSSEVYGSADTLGASYVTVSGTNGVSVHGAEYTYKLSLSVNDGVCDMVAISGSTAGDVSLANAGGTVTATGVDTVSGRVDVYYNTVGMDSYNYRPGYSSFIVEELSQTPGDIAIMGSSNDDGVYDVNIGIPLSGCVHVWDEGVVTQPATYTEKGIKTYTCTKCGETVTEVIPSLISDIVGDTDGDGLLNVKDIVYLKKYMAGSVSLDAAGLARADTDGDGSVTLKDVQKLRRMIAG